jgi:glyoxylase-like metal-dependent hydrolase (beta-lactamase superfamily II)/rhodanese-related sulfurtransferase
VYFRQFQLPCLSLYSYLIADESTGRAVVVDPQRDISEYLDEARARGFTIERVIETHFHADFLSGHLELAAVTGAVISYGDVAEPDFPIEPLADGEHLSLGDVDLEVLHTPGHTPEGISIVVRERADAEPWGVLTGDTLFIGDVGRPDLLAAAGRSPESMARGLYRSLVTKLLTLPDSTRVFPAHGAGSACGKSLSAASESTIGEQRATNYALRVANEDDFVGIVTNGLSDAPPYFGFAARTNRSSHALLNDREPPKPLDLDEVLALQAQGAVLVDTRGSECFASGHLRGSINVGLDGRFAEYAGDVVSPDRPIVLLGDSGRVAEARVRFARIGFDAVVGAIDNIDVVLNERPELSCTASRISARDLEEWMAVDPQLQIVDVRNPAEIEAGHIQRAVNLPLTSLTRRMTELDADRPVVVYCASGYRSSIAASVLRAQGHESVAELLGGYGAWCGRHKVDDVVSS